MKKFIIAIFLFFLSIYVFASDEKTTIISDSNISIEVDSMYANGNYTIPCFFCKRSTLETNVGYSYCLGCPTWRRYDLESKHYVYKYNEEKKEYRYTLVDPKHPGHFVYKCPHGHTLYVKYK